MRERLHAVKEIARDMLHAQREKIANLRAGDQDGNAVGKANDHGPWKIFNGGAHARDAEQHKQNARHHGA